MGYRNDEGNVSCTFAAHFLLRYLNTATIADYAFVADALVFSAMALIVLGRTKNAFAEETVALGLIRTIVNGLRLQNLTIRV